MGFATGNPNLLKNLPSKFLLSGRRERRQRRKKEREEGESRERRERRGRRGGRGRREKNEEGERWGREEMRGKDRKMKQLPCTPVPILPASSL